MPSDHPEQPRVRPSVIDIRLLAVSRDTIERSRQLLIETQPQIDPHRMINAARSGKPFLCRFC